MDLFRTRRRSNAPCQAPREAPGTGHCWPDSALVLQLHIIDHMTLSTMKNYSLARIMLLFACVAASSTGWTQSSSSTPSGQTVAALSVSADTNEPYTTPIPGLSQKELAFFERGKKALGAKWVVFPSLNGDWGLGPTFIADACTGCHLRGGRGVVNPASDALLIHQLIRLSVPGTTATGAPQPHPDYAGQLQVMGAQFGVETNVVPAEGKAFIDWRDVPFEFPDGLTIVLREPVLRIEQLNFGPLGDSTMTSLRNTQALVGLGFLEAVPDEALQTLAESQKGMGLNGRLNVVWDDIENAKAYGRFGWKANEPTIPQQIAGAFRGDLGVTSPVYGTENCPDVQKMCKQMPPGNSPELIQSDWDAITFFIRASAVPERRQPDDAAVLRGERLFDEIGCAACHVPTLTTGDYPPVPSLSNIEIHAYTDLLLHDMGEKLADGRPDFEAGPRDWRTPPLWGIGLSQGVNGSTHLLHDGRARSVLEAIVWHGGEAQASASKFAQLPRSGREDVVRFVDSL